MSTDGCRDLRVELLQEPLALATAEPRFSWIAGHAQTAYRLTVETTAGDIVWDSGRVDDADTSLRSYGGPPLAPDADFVWRVSSWSGDDVRTATSTFGTAPSLTDWTASWVRPVQEPTVVERWTLLDWIRGAQPDAPVAERLRPAHLLRQRFTLRERPVRGRLHITARGIYSAHLNAQAVGDEVLAPGFDSYTHRISVQTYDVSAQLQAGDNALGVALADGWWAGRIGLTGSSAQFGDTTSATWTLVATFADGTTQTVTSDAGVCSIPGPWRYADLFVGEHFDARELAAGWDAADFDDAQWEPVEDAGVDARVLVPFRGEPVRRVAELSARSVTAADAGWVVDFGQVIAGRVRLTVRGLPAGHAVAVEHTETLDADGRWFVNIAGINKEQRDVFVSAGLDETRWEPEFTFHGFRYARVTGLDRLDPADVTAIVLSSDLEQTGRFSSSDARLNRLHENVVWSQRANFLSVPTDCPQRERAGWTGDLQVFAQAATNNALVLPFLSRWLDNVRADQRADGRVTVISPYTPYDAEAAAKGQGIGSIVAAAGWSDAIAIVPWVLYERYGDVRVLEENFDAVLAWIGYQTDVAAAGLPAGIDAGQLTPQRRDRQRLLYNTGEHFGDWLTPSTLEGRPTHEAIGIAPALTSELVAPMFQAHTLTLAARMATVLERDAAAGELAARAAHVRAAFAAEYLDADGALPVELQGMYALALGLDIVPAHLRDRAGDRLAELVRARGNRLDTGFLSVSYLLDALWDTGHRDLARAVLWQDESPSWLYAVDHGATTIWETWDAIAADGTIRAMSLNHYAFGCVDDWLYRRVAGIAPSAPGWRRARIAPDVEAGVDHVSAEVGTPYGPLAVAWERHADTLTVEVAVPFGIDAELLVDDRTVPLAPGRSNHTFTPARSLV
ncbi:alpha-L-rhamnosidase [Microbacterium sp. SS28]|uniref:alpha-L-rhamnosidase n=1 Tax=Microbacterium sp. SS28 TaxID=2919948 RepID=UPI001FA9F395|nr:alpha-L-rhamnosidase [Microbacterium sp. SS28]